GSWQVEVRLRVWIFVMMISCGSLAATISMMDRLVKTFRSPALSDVMADGVCASTTITIEMINAGTGNERSRLGDMAGLHALTRDLLAPLNFSPWVLSAWGTKRLTCYAEIAWVRRVKRQALAELKNFARLGR